MKILFWHRKQKENSRGEAPIYCRITINGDRGTDFSTDVFCKLDSFNAGRQEVIGDDIANLKLASIKHKINTIYLELDNKGETITPNGLRDILKGKRNINLTFFQLMDEFRQYRVKQVELGEIKDGTLERCEVAIKNMTHFLIQSNLKNLPIEMVSARIINDFYYWLQSEKKAGPEYSAKTIHIFKSMMNYAILNNYIKNNVIQSLRFKRGPKKKIEFLRPEELEILKMKRFASERLQQVADLFLLQCYTGFSYADLAEFNPDLHIETDNKGREWIIKARAKNEIESVLPYFLDAKVLVEKYLKVNLTGLTLNLPIITNQKYNSYLKEIADICGFSINLTTHIGRKTFGTIALNKGYSIESVSRMLGHSDIKTTQRHYAVILKKRIIEEVMS